MKTALLALLTASLTAPAFASAEDPFCQKKALALGMHRLVGEKADLFGHQYDGDSDAKQIVTAYEINQSNHDEGSFVLNLGWPEKNGLISNDDDGYTSISVTIRNPNTCEHVSTPTTPLLTDAGGCRASAVRSALYQSVLKLNAELGFVGQITSQAVEKKKDSEWLAIVTIATGNGYSGNFFADSSQTFMYQVNTQVKGSECVTTNIVLK